MNDYITERDIQQDRSPQMSIIIIAHNAADYIANAIDSAIKQTLRDLEIICVNDGSIDNTLSIMDRKCKGDPRIKIFTLEENYGQLYARKIGVQNANGKYILFLDADDELDEKACNDLFERMETSQSDVICFEATVFSDTQDISPEKIEEYKEYIKQKGQDNISLNGPELLKDCFVFRKFLWCVWNKCYSLHLIKRVYSSIGHEKIKISEDLLVTFMTLCYTKKFQLIPECYYHYRVGSGITTKGFESINRTTAEAWVEQYRVISLLQRWLAKQGLNREDYKESIDAIDDIVSSNVISMLFSKVNQNWIPELINRAVQYRNTQNLILDIIRITALQRNEIAFSNIVYCLSKTEILWNTQKDIKTIGMYYRRMYNGGVERVISLLAEILERVGYKIIIISEEEQNSKDYPLPKAVKREIIQKNGNNTERVKKWWRIITACDIDIVIYHGWLDPNVMLDQIAIKAQHIPFLLYTHSICNESLRINEVPWYNPEKAYALADMVITLSESDKAWWNALGFRTEKVVNPLTFDNNIRTIAIGNGNNVIWVGRINDEVKQFREAVLIIKEVHHKNPKVVLHVIGATEPPELLDQLQEELRREGFAEYVVFHGYQDDLEPYYKSADVCLSTSAAESFSMVYVESKAYGIPIVAYEIETNDFHRNSKGMIIVPQKDREKAAEGILRLLENEAYRKQMSLEALQEIRELYETPLSDRWINIMEIARKNNSFEAEKNDLQIALISYLRMGEERNEKVKNELEKARMEIAHLSNRNSTIVKENKKLADEKYEIDHQLYTVLNTRSWKIGRIITHYPRVIKKTIQRFLK